MAKGLLTDVLSKICLHYQKKSADCKRVQVETFHAIECRRQVTKALEICHYALRQV